MPNRILFFISLLLSTLFLSSADALAATVNWIGASGGSWHAPTNWDSGTVPDSSSDVVISSSTAIIVITTTTINFNTLLVGSSTGAITLFHGGRMGTAGSITIASTGTILQATTTVQTISGDLTILSNGTLTHNQNNNAQTSSVNFSANTITVNSGGWINANGLGYTGGAVNTIGNGPGGGAPGGTPASGAGGHCGNGGYGGGGATAAGGNGYCDVANLNSIGSGSGGWSSVVGVSGGGLIILSSVGTTTINGKVSATGTNPTAFNNVLGGGGGGGIKITANIVTGTPQSFSVLGGTGSGNGGGGGGGGVNITYTTSNSISSTASYFSIAGGGMNSGSTGIPGGAGLAYFKQVGQNPILYSINTVAGAETFVSTTMTIDTLVLRTSTLAVTSSASLVIANQFPFSGSTSGTFKISSSASSTFSAVGTVTTTDSITLISGGLLHGPSITSLIVPTSSIITVSGTSTIDFPLTSLTLAGGSVLLNPNSLFPNFAINTLNLYGGTLLVSSSVSLGYVSSTLNVDGAAVTLGVSSTFSQNITTVNINSGSMTVNRGATFSSTTVNSFNVGNGTTGATLTFENFTTNTAFTQAANFTVNTSSIVTHAPNSTAQTHIINISATTITVNAGGYISANGKGYTGGSGNGNGPGGGTGGNGSTTDGGGGAHCGNGGQGNGGPAGGTAYCSISSLITMGSGGGGYNASNIGGSGGGLIWLTSIGTTTINGRIMATGTTPSSATNVVGGGGGGGIKITANIVTGTPQVLSVAGGAGSGYGGGGGGGGIYIAYTLSNSVTSSGSYFSVAGGARGGAGTTDAAGSAGQYQTTQTNSAPTLASLVLTALTNGSGGVTVSVVVNDADVNDVKIKTEYKSGTCAAYSGQVTSTIASGATSTYSGSSITVNNADSGGYQISSIKTLSGQNTTTFTWSSAMDAPTGNSQYCLFLTPNDGTVSGGIVSSTVTIDNVKPTVPGRLTVSATGTQNFVLAFGTTSTDTNFLEYKIFYRAASSTVTQTSTAFTSSTDSHLASSAFAGFSTTTIAGLATSTQYAFNIWAFDSFGNSATATAEIAGYTLADTPSSGSQTSRTANSAALSWSSTNPTTTEFFVTNGTNGTTSGWSTSTSFSESSLSCGRTYPYSIKARNGDLVETASLSVNGSTSACATYSPPLVPVASPSTGSSDGLATSTPTTTPPIILPPVVAPPEVFPPAVISPPTTPTIPVSIFLPRFTHLLAVTMTHDEVLYLQQLLNKLGYTVAKTGAGSHGKETKYFGAATRTALLAAQRANHIPATGKIDQTTQALLNKLWQQAFPVEAEIAPVVLAPQAVLGVRVATNFTKDLRPNMISQEVMTLQQTLNRLGYTVAKTGPGSAGHETARFGAATYRAVLTFQKKNGLKTTGVVDAATRFVLNRPY